MYRLLHLRNTWGEFSWLGDWSELSDKWEQVPDDVKKGLKTKGLQEGLFWMSFDDWLRYIHYSLYFYSPNTIV